MSDNVYSTFQHYGTNAERLAFVPAPGAGIKPIYIWYETDTGDTYLYYTSWVLLAGSGGGAISTATYITETDETADLPNSRQIIAGTDITLDVSVPGEITINSTASGSGITELTGDVTAGPGSGSQAATIANDAVTTGKILDEAVTLAKIQDIATDRLLGRDTASSGVTEEIPVTSGIEFTGGPGLGQTTAARTRQIGVTIDGGGPITASGIVGYKSFPVAGTITKWRILGDQAGDCVFDIVKDAFASYPPTTSIVASAFPEVTVGNDSAEDSTLTGWTTSVSAGDVFGFDLISVGGFERLTLELTIVISGA